MRILHVVEATLAGQGLHCLDLVRSQNRAGHEVHIVYGDMRMDQSFREGLDALEGVHLWHMDCERKPTLAALKSIGQCRSYIRKHGPFDIVHGHSSMGGAVSRIAARRKDGVRVYTPNALKTLDPSVEPLGKFVYWALEWGLAWLRTELFIAVSREEAEHVLGLGFPRKRVRIIYNGTDIHPRVSRAAQRRAFGLKATDICALFVGRLEGQKAPLRMVAAMAKLQTKGMPDNFKMVMVGSGPLHDEVAAAIAAAGLDEKVFMVGRHRGVDAMQAADFFCLSSNFEGFPYVLIEAIQCGLPIVTTDIGGAYDLVSQGETGFVVPVGDENGLADAVGRLASDPELRAAFAERNKEIAGKYTAAAMAAATDRAYRDRLTVGRILWRP